jgi:ATP-dependent Lon protease
LTDIPVNRDIAMTGEVTLLGRVLPVGGIKEKILAAVRQNIYSIIIPKSNEKDLVDLPKHVRSKVNILLAETMDQVLEKALVKRLPKMTGARRVKRKHHSPLSSTVQ